MFLLFQQSHEYDGVNWECQVKAFTYINGRKFNRVGYLDIYEPAENCNPGDAVIEYEERKPDVPISYEYAKNDLKKTKEARKRGLKVWQCPYCLNTFPPGRKETALRHVNGSKTKKDPRPPGCPVRRKEEDNFELPARKELILIE